MLVLGQIFHKNKVCNVTVYNVVMQKQKGFVCYNNVSESYLRKRQLRGNAGWFLLWGLGVGAVISGDFYAWNIGLATGGFWGLAIAAFLMAIMYLCMVYSLAELSSALPHAGGFYSFVRNAFGPYWGFICGVAVTLEYMLATSALVFSMSNYIKPLIPHFVPTYVVWLVLYTIFGVVCVHSLEWTLNVSLFLTLVAIMVLGIFYVSMLAGGVFKPELLFNIPPDPGQSAFLLPKGWQGVFATLPYGTMFYLAIEMLPLASEETENVPRNMRLAYITGMITLMILAAFTITLNSGVGGGAAEIAKSEVPLAAGLDAYFGKGSTSEFLTAIALTLGLGASLPTQMYGYGRITFALSRAGYIPRWISVTRKNHIPHRALILFTVVGLICVVLIANGKAAAVDAIILNMAIFGAVISYILFFLSYIKLKLSRPDLPRSYKSPWGIQGAIVGCVLAALALVSCYFTPDYRPGVVGIVVVMILSSLYFFFYSRRRLVAQAPEEAATLNKST
jgi:ethanolamine permease